MFLVLCALKKHVFFPVWREETIYYGPFSVSPDMRGGDISGSEEKNEVEAWQGQLLRVKDHLSFDRQR